MILLGAPYLEQTDLRTYVCSDVNDDGNEFVIRIGTSFEYAKYLVDDRLDAFVVALLPKAMLEAKDIRCAAPVSSDLLYQINDFLIPVLSFAMKEYHKVRVEAEGIDNLTECAGAVATGYSGGVDCMHTVRNMTDKANAPFCLTHLVIANCGAYEGSNVEEKLRFFTDKAMNGIVKDTGLKLLQIDTNLRDVLKDEVYLSVVSYRLSACILAMQKLFSVYYISTTYEFAKFSFDINDCAYADLFLLPHLSTKTTKLFSTGGQKPRIEKLRELSDYAPAQKYLHACIFTRRSKDCRCIKCCYTKLALYALGTLDRFSEVFDLDEFEKNKDWYIAVAMINRDDIHYDECYVMLREKGMIPDSAKKLARTMTIAQKIAYQHKDIFLGTNGDGQ